MFFIFLFFVTVAKYLRSVSEILVNSLVGTMCINDIILSY
jgi:hypothetical protein